MSNWREPGELLNFNKKAKSIFSILANFRVFSVFPWHQPSNGSVATSSVSSQMQFMLELTVRNINFKI